jgi:hypothetical protein
MIQKNDEVLANEVKNRSILNKLIIHPSFNKTLEEIKKLKIKLPEIPENQEMDFNMYVFPQDAELVTNIEDIKAYKLEAKKGEEYTKNKGILISSYDESINKFTGIEGTAFLTSHSLILCHENDYLASNLLTFYFYTRSKLYAEKSKFIKHSEDPEVDSKKDYVKDRIDFIINSVPDNSIIFIDGPLIGGQISDYTIKLNDKLLRKNVIPIFFVKNSTSNLVTQRIKEIRGKYNSDIHWSYEYLKRGERTNLFQYVDKYNASNAKIFCYMKAFNLSPQRVEFHLSTYIKFKNRIPDILNLAYYLLLAQGDEKNPQVRTIAVAEKYARTTLKLFNIFDLMKISGVTPTFNQQRFG